MRRGHVTTWEQLIQERDEAIAQRDRARALACAGEARLAEARTRIAALPTSGVVTMLGIGEMRTLSAPAFKREALGVLDALAKATP